MVTHGRVDANQSTLVSLFHDAHMTVAYTTDVGGGFPDLVVGGVMPCPHCLKKFKQNKIVEVKTAAGRLNDEQRTFHAYWKGQLDVIRSEAVALKLVGIRL